MSHYGVEISPSSRAVLFQGFLKKAPQLNKRGRKKWNERFCVLRANKTLECFKSKKAMESLKNPRKMIDLRECINLEVGLEYKEQQHIFSLGTFKRTFFFGAPSDALMLQWVDCIEKVKNASDKETVQLLDIGLRKTPATPLTKLRTSQSLSKLAALSSSIPNISLIGSSSQTNDSLPSTGKGLDKLVNDKGERSPSLPPSSAVGESHTPPKSPLSTETSPTHLTRSKDSYSDEEMIQPRQRIGHYYVNVTAKPRAGKTAGKTSTLSKPKEATQNQTERLPEGVDTRRRGSLPPEVTQKVPPPRLPTRVRKGSVDSSDDPTNPFSALIQKGHVQSIQANLLAKSQESDSVKPFALGDNTGNKPFALGMKRSFRYRHITLKKEQPLPLNVLEEGSSDEDTEDEEHRPGNLRQMYRMKEFASSTPNLTLIEQGHIPVRGNNNRPQKVRNFPILPNFGITPPQTNYSKITVVGVKVHSCSNSPTHKPNVAVETKSILTTKKKTVPIGLRTSNSEGTIIAGGKSEKTKEEFYPLPPPLCDDTDILLPDRHPSDTYPNLDNISISSLDEILVDPPEMFDDQSTLLEDPTSNNDEEEGITEDDISVVNRNSTESNDTGYTSTSSPSHHHTSDEQDKKLTITVEDHDDCSSLSLTTPLATPSSETTCVCVPLVFHTKNIWKPKGRGRGLLGLQICLVEQNSSIISELVSLKQLEGYSLIECEVERELSAVKTSPQDSLIVETCLEDLEFGFSVVRSTQKDLLDRKVREFHFEVRNLFSSNRKPFSCDVHIKHGNDDIVLPVEITG